MYMYMHTHQRHMYVDGQVCPNAYARRLACLHVCIHIYIYM